MGNFNNDSDGITLNRIRRFSIQMMFQDGDLLLLVLDFWLMLGYLVPLKEDFNSYFK